jgi:hypothetical protein
MNGTTRPRLVGLALVLVLGGCRAAPPAGVEPERVADYVYAVIQADRTVYARHVVERLQDREAVIRATEDYEQEKTLPLPAQMLRLGSQLAAERGELRYALISSWAINKANLPKTDFERQGLEQVAADPTRPHRAHQTINGRRWFLALYPDLAVSTACVNCHNRHPESTRRDFAEGDVMGGVVISLPLEGGAP